MMRLPLFSFRAPRTLEEAVRILHGEGPDAMPLAGGTDLLPNMKRRQQVPRTLLSLRGAESLRQLHTVDSGFRIGACMTLSEIAGDPRFRNGATALVQAASQVATPQIRNMATLGGNLCLDTRCNYYDQTYEWRKSIDFCIKKDGVTCWVAPSSPKCMVVSSTDTAPALMALGARVRLVSQSGERAISLSDLYNNDGMNYLRRKPDEILAEVLLDSTHGWRSTYWKVRRRGAFDFPVLSVAVAARFAKHDGTGAACCVTTGEGGSVIEEARVVIGSAASSPLVAEESVRFLVGRSLTDETVVEAARLAARIAKPLDNTDFDMSWRKKVATEFVTYALRELRGDDVGTERAAITRLPST